MRFFKSVINSVMYPQLIWKCFNCTNIFVHTQCWSRPSPLYFYYFSEEHRWINHQCAEAQCTVKAICSCSMSVYTQNLNIMNRTETTTSTFSPCKFSLPLPFPRRRLRPCGIKEGEVVLYLRAILYKSLLKHIYLPYELYTGPHLIRDIRDFSKISFFKHMASLSNFIINYLDFDIFKNIC